MKSHGSLHGRPVPVRVVEMLMASPRRFPPSWILLLSVSVSSVVRGVRTDRAVQRPGAWVVSSGDGGPTSGCPTERMFLCRRSGECIDGALRCDTVDDCSDRTDELYCDADDDSSPCVDNFFKCRNGQCIPSVHTCDGVNDCGDNTDEGDCDDKAREVPSRTCPDNQYECLTNSQCIPLAWRCNGRRDCKDGSDESAHLCHHHPSAHSSGGAPAGASIVTWLGLLPTMLYVSSRHLNSLVTPP